MRLAFPGMMDALAQRVTIVTPTPTLAAVAIEQFNREQLAQSRQAWERPDIVSFDAWLIRIWQQARFSISKVPSLLSPSQEREVWRQIIQEDRPDLFDVRAMAAMSQRAAGIVSEYQIPTACEAWQDTPDAQQFLGWYLSLQKRLKAHNWITRADLWRLLPEWIANGSLATGPVIFAGLTTVSPGLKAFSRALGALATQVGLTPSRSPAVASLAGFEAVSQEFNHAARAIRNLLEAKQTDSIGVLVADLKSNASNLLHAFNEVLYPSSPPQDHLHIQIGKLIDHPLISNALLLLQLAKTRIHHASAGAILRSPFIDGAREERHLRALANHKLKRARELDFSPADIEKEIWDCPILYQVFRSVEKVKRKLKPTMSLPEWSAAFSDILLAAKWPATDPLTEAEQQAIAKWQDSLSTVASLGLVSPAVDLDSALGHLESILNRPAEQGSWASPVHIIDASLAEGFEFDYTFILNGTEDVWPAPAFVSPLIPYKLQRMHDVPASKPESVTEERERKTELLFSSAPIVHCSHTGRLSPLMRAYTGELKNPEIWSGCIAAESFTAADLNCEEDSQAPPLVQSDQVHGGAGVIKAQSLCPFKAFAEYRLNARGEDEASFGFDALERGECAHKALEYIWTELGTQQALNALSDAELHELIDKHLGRAVEEDAASGPIRVLTSLAERDRLTTLIFDWLQVDKQRKHHFTVERIEHNEIAEVGGLKLKLRMDRVDRLNNGSLCLIDYKSGKQTAGKLEGARPKEPQLLVYAAAISDPIDGLYFGELQNRRARAVGHGAEKHFPKQRGRSTVDHPSDWDDFLVNAKQTVHRLADEFKHGNAAVDPQRGACEYCKIKPICRVGSGAISEEVDE